MLVLPVMGPYTKYMWF